MLPLHLFLKHFIIKWLKQFNTFAGLSLNLIIIEHDDK